MARQGNLRMCFALMPACRKLLILPLVELTCREIVREICASRWQLESRHIVGARLLARISRKARFYYSVVERILLHVVEDYYLGFNAFSFWGRGLDFVRFLCCCSR